MQAIARGNRVFGDKPGGLVVDYLGLAHELKKALAANKAAARNFENLAPSYRKQYIGWFLGARREETRSRRLKEIVSLLSRNKKMGMR